MLRLSVDNYSGCPCNQCAFFPSFVSSNVQADAPNLLAFFRDWRFSLW